MRAILTRGSATLGLVVSLLAWAGPATAASPITLQARALLDGRFESGGWAAISVTVSNEGAPVTGYLAADGLDGTVRRLVELPAGSHKQISLYVRPQTFTRNLEVRFEDAGGKKLLSATAAVSVLSQSGDTVAIVGDAGAMLRPQVLARGDGMPDPLQVGPTDLPERPEPLRGIEGMVWAADSSGLSEAQRRAIEGWVAAGGQLIVLGGPDWQARTAAFSSLLPVTAIAARDGVDVHPFASWLGADPPDGGATLTAAVGQPDAGAVPLLGSGADTLLSTVTRGAGRVTFIGLDLATEPFRAWPAAGQFWGRLLPDTRVAEQFGGFVPAQAQDDAMTQALANIPALDVPSAELLLAVLGGYILLIGPISYLVLRRMDRRELAWITAPVLVVLFSVGTYGIGSSLKGSSVIVNQIAVVRSTPGGSAATVSTYAGVFSPTRATYDLTVQGDALIAGLATTFMDGNTQVPTYATEQGDTAHLRGLAVSVFGLQAVRADAVIPYTPSLDVDWTLGLDTAEGSVTNRGQAPMEDVAVVTDSGGVLVGDLAPGQSKPFTLHYRSLNGASASEQVYGMVNFDPTSDQQRESFVRRQVIDAIVGYGGFPGKISTVASGIEHGPYVIGWRADDDPLPIQLDGQQPQHFNRTVEVVATQPRLASGKVRLQASQLSTRVLSTDGQASSNDPGFVMVANGEAVFGVDLPLDAVGLQPTGVTLIIGNDPGMVFYDQPNFGGFLPPGYRVSVYDVAAGEWVDVGDPANSSRFTLDDPTSVIDDAGMIRIRVAGTNVPAAVGQVPVYVGASVDGVMP